MIYVVIVALCSGGILGAYVRRQWDMHVTACLISGLVETGVLDSRALDNDAIERALAVGWVDPRPWKRGA